MSRSRKRDAAPGSELLPEAPSCPFCGNGDTELMSPFGGQLSVATYWCLGCRSPFEFMKWSSGLESGLDQKDSD